MSDHSEFDRVLMGTALNSWLLYLASCLAQVTTMSTDTEGVPAVTHPLSLDETDHLNLDAIQAPPNSPPAGNATVKHWRDAYTKLRERFMTMRTRACDEQQRAQLAETRAETAESELDARDAQHIHLYGIMPRMLTVLSQVLQQLAIEPTPETIIYDPSCDGDGASCIMVRDGDWNIVIDGDAEETRVYHPQLIGGRFAVPHQLYGLDLTSLMTLVKIREAIDKRPNTGTTPKVIIDQMVKPTGSEFDRFKQWHMPHRSAQSATRLNEIFRIRGTYYPAPAAKIDPRILSLYSDALWGPSSRTNQANDENH